MADLAVRPLEDGAGVDEGHHLAHLHEHALRAGQHVGVALGVAHVELEAGTPLALEATAEDVDHTSTGGPRRDCGEGSRAPHPPLGNRHR
jgi:hypothetical protein